MVPTVDIYEGKDIDYILWEGFAYAKRDVVEE